MKISSEQYYEIIDRVAYEGDAELSIGPLATVPVDVPTAWAALLTSSDPAADAARLWGPIADYLPRIHRGLQERLHGVGVLRTEEVPASLLYFFRDGEDWVLYRGGPPLSDGDLAGARLPDEFVDFYRIHDGWVSYYSEDRGPSPQAGWLPLSTLWTDTAWKLPPGDISVETTIVVYRDGNELAFAYDTSASPALPVRCHDDGAVDVLLDVWVAIDREIGEVLETLEPRPDRKTAARPAAIGSSEGMLRRYDQVLARLPHLEALAAHVGGGAAYEQAADLLLQCALLERHGTGRRDRIVDYYRRALQHWCSSMELCGVATPTELLDWFGVAGSLNEIGTAHFIATIPTSLWADDSPEALQARTLFCLYLGDAEHATMFAEELMELALADEAGSDEAPEITASLLRALCRKEPDEYARWRQNAVDRLCRADSERRRPIPWSVRLHGFDAVAYGAGLAGPPPPG